MFSAFCAFCPSVAQLIYGTASAGMMSAAAFLPIPPPPFPQGTNSMPARRGQGLSGWHPGKVTIGGGGGAGLAGPGGY